MRLSLLPFPGEQIEFTRIIHTIFDKFRANAILKRFYTINPHPALSLTKGEDKELVLNPDLSSGQVHFRVRVPLISMNNVGLVHRGDGRI